MKPWVLLGAAMLAEGCKCGGSEADGGGDADSDADSDSDSDTDSDADSDSNSDSGTDTDTASDTSVDGPNQSVVVRELRIAGESLGCDLDGDATIDNLFAESLGTADFFDDAIASALGDGSLIVLLEIRSLGDSTGQNDADVDVAACDGVDGDDPANPANNFAGGSSFWISADSVDVDGNPITSLPGAIAAGDLSTQEGSLSFSFAMGDVDVTLAMARASMTAVVNDDAMGTRIDTLTEGLVCGVGPAPTFKDVPIDLGVPGMPPTLLDLLVVGFDFLIEVRPTQPDIDLDDDGLETFEDTDGDQVVDRCVDGDGTQIDGVDCARDARIADGWSMAFDYEAIWSQILGVR